MMNSAARFWSHCMSKQTANNLVTQQVQFISVNSFLFLAIIAIFLDCKTVAPSHTCWCFCNKNTEKDILL
jgi:hypothetical protein